MRILAAADIHLGMKFATYDEVGPEALHGRQAAPAPGGAEFGTPVARRQRQVKDVAAAGFFRIAGAGIQRNLMARNEQRVGRLLENLLRAVAVMDIEIHDGDPAGAVLSRRGAF